MHVFLPNKCLNNNNVIILDVFLTENTLVKGIILVGYRRVPKLGRFVLKEDRPNLGPQHCFLNRESQALPMIGRF